MGDDEYRECVAAAPPFRWSPCLMQRCTHPQLILAGRLLRSFHSKNISLSVSYPKRRRPWDSAFAIIEP